MTRVLVVDDDALMCSLMRLVLEHAGHDVLIVDRYFEDLLDPAWHAWAEVDVLLCDLNLAETVTGTDILAVAAVDHPHIRRIALTGAPDEFIADAQEVAHRVMRKPVNAPDILAAIS